MLKFSGCPGLRPCLQVMKPVYTGLRSHWRHLVFWELPFLTNLLRLANCLFRSARAVRETLAPQIKDEGHTQSSRALCTANAGTGRQPSESRICDLHSISSCLPNLRASQCITQFAALFIVVRSDRSIAGNLIQSITLMIHMGKLSYQSSAQLEINQSVPPQKKSQRQTY